MSLGLGFDVRKVCMGSWYLTSGSVCFGFMGISYLAFVVVVAIVLGDLWRVYGSCLA